MGEFENQEQMPAVPARPKMLSVLCILTFIGSGFLVLFSIVAPMVGPTLVEMMKANPDPRMSEEEMDMAVRMYTAGWGYHMLNAVLCIGSIVGAALMWKLKKNGFHFYAFSNLAMLFVPTLVLGMPISWPGIAITVAFVVMYALFLKYMK